jgi:hypothetical protein
MSMPMTMPNDYSRGEDEQRAVSGMDSRISHQVGRWELGVRFSEPYAVRHGALIFVGKLDGELLCSILTPEDRINRGY